MSECPNPKECCDELTRVWAAMGNPAFNNTSCSEQVAAIIAERDRACELLGYLPIVGPVPTLMDEIREFVVTRKAAQ